MSVQAAMQLVRVYLSRANSGQSWGFTLQGGVEEADGRLSPLLVKLVQPASVAARAGLQAGDVLRAINERSADAMRHDEAKAEILRSGDQLQLLLERVSPQSSPQSPRSQSQSGVCIQYLDFKFAALTSSNVPALIGGFCPNLPFRFCLKVRLYRAGGERPSGGGHVARRPRAEHRRRPHEARVRQRLQHADRSLQRVERGGRSCAARRHSGGRRERGAGRRKRLDALCAVRRADQTSTCAHQRREAPRTSRLPQVLQMRHRPPVARLLLSRREALLRYTREARLASGRSRRLRGGLLQMMAFMTSSGT